MNHIELLQKLTGIDEPLFESEREMKLVEISLNIINNLKSEIEKLQSDECENYSIEISSVSKFRKELMKMIEQVKYNTGEYKDISSSQVAEKFERKINSHYKT